MYGAARVCSSIEGGQFADYEPSIYWRKIIRGHEHQATARGRVTAENGASHSRVGPSSGKGISNLVAFSNLSADFNLSDPLTNFTPSSFEPCPNSNISSALAEPGTIRGSFTVRKRLSSSPPTGKLKGPLVALPPRCESRDRVSAIS